MADSVLEAGKALVFNVTVRPGGEISINISTNNLEVVDRLWKGAITLGALYAGYELARPLIDAAVKKALGGERDDQEIRDIKPGSLHVLLHCSTDDRFLEVLADYESGKMKEHFEEEFSQAGIKVKGMKVKVENMAAVNETKEAINERIRKKEILSTDLKYIATGDAESYMKTNVIVSMAARWENAPEGYDVSRFVGEVRKDLLCSICQEVPKDPRLCMNKDHLFCLAHISQHLKNSQRCPVCRDPLTPETLRRPEGFLKNYLNDLKIRCDHHGRGCPDVVPLENLPTHVDRCEFAPVMCRNEGCRTVVNKRDKESHEKYFCQFRIAKCHDCKDIKGSQDEMKAKQDEMKDQLKVQMRKIQDKLAGFEGKQDETKDEIKAELNKMKVEINMLIRKEEETKDGIEMKLNKMNDKMTGIERKHDQIQESVDEMKQQFGKMMMIFNQALPGGNVNNNGGQVTDPRESSDNPDIVILGGFYAPGLDKASNTVEKFNIAEETYTELPRMNKPRAQSASCVHDGDVIITGGWDGEDGTDSIEILKINQHPLQWTVFGGKLPVKLTSHAAIVYQNKLYAVGGYNWDEGKTSDVIYEVDLAPPYAAKILTRMPQERQIHRAELANGKLFILAGTTTGYSKDALNSVVVYDFTTDEFKICPPLPKPVCEISTITWGNMILVVGGEDKNGQVLNDVIMYDTGTGRSKRLPSLKHKRSGPSAVIVDDVILVLGGWNNEQEHLNSAESFTLGSVDWKELPRMNEKREYASVVVVPRV